MAANFSAFVVRFFINSEVDGEQAGILDTYGGTLSGFLLVNSTLVTIFVASVLFLRAEFNKCDIIVVKRR